MSLPALELPPVTEIEPPPRSTTVDRGALARYVPFVVSAIALAAGLNALDTQPIGGYYDDAFYVILGKSIATGQGYRNLNLPGAPYATHYPPGYPLLLALLWRIGPAFPANIILFKAANALLLAVAAAFAYRFGRERLGLSTPAAVIATVAGTASTPALYLSSMLLSETMFLALALPFLWWAEARTRRTERDLRGAMALGIGAGLLFLVRSQAIAIMGALVCVYLLRRRWKEAAVAAGAAAATMAPWLAWVATHDATYHGLLRGDYGSYFAWFIDGLRQRGAGFVGATVRRNAPDMFAHVVHRLQPPSNPVSEAIFFVSAGVLAIIGSARLSRRAPVTFAFLLGYLTIAAVWPFVPLRFVVGIWVILLLVLASGADLLLTDGLPNVIRRIPRASVSGRIIGGVATALLVWGVLAYNIRGYQRHWWSTTQGLGNRWIKPKVPWILANTDTAAIIATDHDEGAIYLYTGRRSVPVTTFTALEYLEPRSIEADAAVMRALAAQFRPQYLVLSSVRLRPAAAAMSTAGIALGDGEHQVVPWAFALRWR